jgi:2-isopropylmalate synthase
LEKEQLSQAFELAKLLLGKKKVLEEMDLRYIAETTQGKTEISLVALETMVVSSETSEN